MHMCVRDKERVANAELENSSLESALSFHICVSPWGRILFIFKLLSSAGLEGGARWMVLFAGLASKKASALNTNGRTCPL